MAALRPNLQANPRSPRSGTSLHQMEEAYMDMEEWPGSMDNYMPELDVGKSIVKRIKGDPGDGLFCPPNCTTSINVMEVPSLGDPVRSNIWCENDLNTKLGESDPAFRMICLRMAEFERPREMPISRLAISKTAFGKAAKHLSIPPSFINCLMKYRGGAPILQGSRLYKTTGSHEEIYDFWNIMRIRTARSCLDKNADGKPHALKYQMDPFNLLHLPLNQEASHHTDILSFELGVFFQYNITKQTTTVFTINTGTTKVHDLTPDELQSAVAKVCSHAGTNPSRQRKDPFWFHLVYTGLALQYWRSVLLKFQKQLIKHDETIEDHNMGKKKQESLSSAANQSLHAMAAHGLRYETELAGINTVLEELIGQHQRIKPHLPATEEEWTRVHDALIQRYAEAKSVMALQRELSKKTKNTLAFLFHAITSEQAKLQTTNGEDLKKIMEINKEDVALTITLSKQMRTIAVVTMFFLPAATIAAIMSMPWFDDDNKKSEFKYVQQYAGSTAAITAAVFALYLWRYFKGSWLRRVTFRRKKGQGDADLEMNNVGRGQNGEANGLGIRKEDQI